MAVNIKGVTDLLSVQTITWAANKIVNSARGFARAKRIGRVAKVKTGTARVSKNELAIDILISKVGAAFEFGSGKHDPKNPHFIEITPKTKPKLVFEGTNGHKGLIHTEHVNHPGVAPRPFLQPAKDRHRKEIKERIAQEVGSKMRLTIRSMKRVI